MKNYNFLFTEHEIQILISGLGELPMKVAMETFMSVQRQLAQEKEEAE